MNDIWSALKVKLNTAGLDPVKGLLNGAYSKPAELPSNMPLESRLDPQTTLDSISVWEALTMGKKIFILTAQILVTVMETGIWILKAILSIIT